MGELQEKWQFPSDHLPVGMNLDGLKIASWNVLNPLYMNWVIEKNSKDQNVVLYDTRQLMLLEKQSPSGVFSLETLARKTWESEVDPENWTG